MMMQFVLFNIVPFNTERNIMIFKYIFCTLSLLVSNLTNSESVCLNKINKPKTARNIGGKGLERQRVIGFTGV